MPGSDNLAVRPYCERSDTDMVEQAFESDESGNPSAEEDALGQHIPRSHQNPKILG